MLIRTAVLLLLSAAAFGLPEATPLEKQSSEWKCDKCCGYALKGSHLASPRTTYRIDSDLPEIYSSNGVLYTTRQVLPPFDTHTDGPVPLEMRTQVSNGFSTINDSFEVFVYHLSVGQEEDETRRIVVLVENEGENDYSLLPKQVMLHGPNRGDATSIESVLTERVLLEQWDRPFERVEIQPSEAVIIGHTLRIGARDGDPDGHPHPFVTGTLRCDVWGAGLPNFVVSVISIPGDIPQEEWLDAAMSLRDVGANSAESSMDLRIEPPECHVRRVVGTAMNVMWRNDPMVIDVATMPDDLLFQMANFSVQTVECPDTRQSVAMMLYPPYVHADSIGNYMMEYHVTLHFINSSEESKTFEVQFGKDDAPIGLAWQMIVGEEEAYLEELEPLPVQIKWAGPRRVTGEPWYRVTMLEDGPIALGPGESRWVSMRLMAIGTSSLPWQLHVVGE